MQRYAGDEAVARTTLHVRTRIPMARAEEWIASHDRLFIQKKRHCAFHSFPAGRALRRDQSVAESRQTRGEIGYWIAMPYWNRGFCTEATRVLLAYGFATLPLARIHAHHFAHNPASGRVMAKAGMKRIGYLKEHVLKNGELIDVVAYAIARGRNMTAARREKCGRPGLIMGSAFSPFGLIPCPPTLEPKPHDLRDRPPVFTADLDATLAWYRDKLGFGTQFTYGKPTHYAGPFAMVFPFSSRRC